MLRGVVAPVEVGPVAAVLAHRHVERLPDAGRGCPVDERVLDVRQCEDTFPVRVRERRADLQHREVVFDERAQGRDRLVVGAVGLEGHSGLGSR